MLTILPARLWRLLLVFPFLALWAVVLAPPAPLAAQDATDLLKSVVQLKIRVPADARTAESLGTRREGSGVVIDAAGLVVTIGYLIVESDQIELVTATGRTVPASFVGYDHDSGFGLVRADGPLGLPPLRLGDSATLGVRDRVIVAAHGGADGAVPAMVVSRRPFAGTWEYLLDNAIFTSPPIAGFGGAALIGRDGKLLGVGSLFVGDAAHSGQASPGNMFVPIDLLKPILADLLAHGRTTGPSRPWIGLGPEEVKGHLFIGRVTAGGPAAQAGLQPGDILVGVGGEPVTGMADFYRKLWNQGAAGAEIKLRVLKGASLREVAVKSIDRLSFLKMNRTY